MEPTFVDIEPLAVLGLMETFAPDNDDVESYSPRAGSSGAPGNVAG